MAMAEFILFVLIFVGIMAVSALIFGGWFLVMIVRGIASFLGLRPAAAGPAAIGPRRPSGAVQIGPVANQRTCPYELCKAANDGAARFCRRCGRELGAPSHPQVRRVAAW
jgi:hypothetical protein